MIAKSIDIWKNSRLLDFATGRMALGDAMFCRRNTGFLGFSTIAKTIAAIRPSDYESYSNTNGKRATGCFFFDKPMISCPID
ncbi:MAG: hypothetical protein EAZ60_24805 [Oscillatoriales cyanobacterium]|nr:MAG: hypothetical protein EAZ83_16550 [Oscillatoriales cyanobacterium]TAE98036.1 MAG: hypothetical protein EAZ79_09255 [Oscillatoriales cyanobacterium]TAF18507.1 MAG: hypothetical protein EAZ73_17860 [Oscillatoriales cyanobacterium]TAF34778.1 MAG: hypothetical protein EAZ69_13920 [Oscillatoriales cyanobacterium]TAF51952.1 MAG: hypothetical protein EAZ60_24805 [Oscillatoriales cyanobacterium]